VLTLTPYDHWRRCHAIHHATHGNLNNHIGVPVTLMRLEPSHRSAVIEMGANRVGDVAELVRLARPTVGLITNAGAEHLEGFGNLDGVAQGEGEMVAGLGADATGIINADDAYAAYWRGVSKAARIVTFGVPVPQYLRDLNWLELAGRGSDNPREASLKINNVFAIKNAVINGTGIAVLPSYMVEPGSGLVQLLPEEQVPSFATYFVYPAELKNSARVHVFRDFLLSKAQNWSY